jgi:hypothetical protein
MHVQRSYGALDGIARGAAETINRLRRVADGKHRRIQRFDQPYLLRIGVLKFVDQHVVVSIAQPGMHARRWIGRQRGGACDQIVVIGDPQIATQLRDAFEYRDKIAQTFAAIARQFGAHRIAGSLQIGDVPLGVANERWRTQHSGREAARGRRRKCFAQDQFGDRTFDQTSRREAGSIDAEQARREPVERAHLHPAGNTGQTAADPIAQFANRSSRERKREDAFRRHAGFDQTLEPANDDTRFAGARNCFYGKIPSVVLRQDVLRAGQVHARHVEWCVLSAVHPTTIVRRGSARRMAPRTSGL